MNTASLSKPGTLINVRGREWVVLPDSTEALLIARPVGGLDEEITGILPAVEPVKSTEFQLPTRDDLGDFASGQLLREAARLSTRAAAGPFRSFGRIAVEPRPYQLVPLMMALKLDPVRLLIADDVGIGKTIEAAVIARELLDRGEIRRLAMLCPPHLAEQWQHELAEKFHIEAELVLSSTIQRLARQYQFFHWHLEFPDVFVPSLQGVGNREVASRGKQTQGPLSPYSLSPYLPTPSGGFDVILGNPPWERTAFEAVPYFVSRVPDIANAETTAKREALIAGLPRSHPTIWEAYQNDLRIAEGSDGFYYRSGRYRFSASGRTNTFALFTELALNITIPHGRVGLIIPSALATDTPYSGFWGDIVENRSLISMFDFENRGIFFPNVHRSYKFSLFTFRPVADASVSSLFGFFLDAVSDIRSSKKIFTLHQTDVASINPITKLLPVCRSVEDFLLLVTLHKRGCLLMTEALPWVGLTSSATGSDWQFNADEVPPQVGFSPMWEAKCIHQFNHRFST